MKLVLTLFVLGIVAFALGAQWYVTFDIYATYGADASSGYFTTSIGLTFLVAVIGGIAAAVMD